MEKCIVSFSGGKDSVLALHDVLKEQKRKVDFLFVTVNKSTQRVNMHGVRKELITRQGFSIGIHTRKLYLPENVSMELYSKMMEAEMLLMKQRGVHSVIFGDIFLEDLKKYREEQLSVIGLKAEFPLWNKNTTELFKTFLELGYKAKIVSINLNKLSKDFLEKDLSIELLNTLPEQVDICGENGEYHTFVYDGPIFHHPVKFEVGAIVEKAYTHSGIEYPYAFLDLIPID